MSSTLLESGNGELEIIEFIVSGIHYAINIVKVKEVIEIKESAITKVPENKLEMGGVIVCRDEILPLVDLKYVLTRRKDEVGNRGIVCEFNKVKVVFNIDEIVAVKRIKWSDIIKPDNISESQLSIGNILEDEKVIIMLDFEKIVTDINPKTGISEERLVNVEYKDRSDIKLVLADDSPLIRRLLKDTLIKAGFTSLNIFNDGKEALDYLQTLKNAKGDDFKAYASLLITDIEMPQMDGLTLTRNVKEDPILKTLPVIIFSSLITDDLRHKGEIVGANAQLSKPEIENLIHVIDEFLGY